MKHTIVPVLLTVIGLSSAGGLSGHVPQAAAASSYTVTDQQVAVSPEMQTSDPAMLSITFGQAPDAPVPDVSPSSAESFAADLFDPCRLPEANDQAGTAAHALQDASARPTQMPQPIPTPEPGTLSLLGLGGLLLALRLRPRQ